MGLQDAINDKVRYVNSKARGEPTLYFPLCSVCGQEVLSFNYIKNRKYKCKKCKLRNNLADKENRIEENEEIKEKKFENAVSRIKNISKNFKKYDKAIKKVHDVLHIDGWFQSTEEIMVAIELERQNIEYRHQVKFGIYRADFVLDKKKIVLEIDGTLFHTKNTEEKENLRDNLICFNLGPEWEVIRVTDKLINENITKLAKAIDKTYSERKKIRNNNNGMLPEWYTSRKI